MRAHLAVPCAFIHIMRRMLRHGCQSCCRSARDGEGRAHVPRLALLEEPQRPGRVVRYRPRRVGAHLTVAPLGARALMHEYFEEGEL